MTITPQDLANLVQGVGDKDADLQAKKRAIDEYRVESTYSAIEESKKELTALGSLVFSLGQNKSILKGIERGREYMDSAAQCMRFVCNEFNGKIPFFPKNIILAGAYSADGKSTLTSNICYDLLCQKKKVLVITNEEALSDVYNRVTCISQGWIYANHENFTKAQKDFLDEAAKNMSSQMYVIDNDHDGASDLTVSYEGIVSILSSIEKQEEKFDAIVIDYYQNISMMKADMKMEDYKVQAKFVKWLDQFKNRYPAPIVIMSQLKAVSKENTLPFKERIEGRKSIYNIATFAIEIRADKPNLRTEWTIHKSRFNDCQGQTFYTGWKRGRYVPYDNAFRLEVEDTKMKRAAEKSAAMNRSK